MKKRILINRHIIKANKTHNKADPPISVQTYKGIERGTQVEILGPATLVYSPDKPLKCGATVWLETEAEVKVV